MATDKFKSIFTKTIATVNVKTSSFIESAKLKTHINTLEKEIENLFNEIGKKSFESWAKVETDTFDLNDCFISVQQKKEQIATLEKEIYKLELQQKEVLGAKELYICPSCKTTFENQIKFCKKCGAKMNE